jgi:hypothetical protein
MMMRTPSGARRVHARLAALAALTALTTPACDAPTVPPRAAADVYEFRLATSPPLTLRWPAGALVRVFVVAGGPAGDLLRVSLQQGADAWNQHALLDEYQLVETSDLARADVLLAWSGATLPVNTDACPRTPGRGVTTFCLDGDRLYRYPLAGDGAGRVRMLVTIAAQLASEPELTRASVAHELGHVLGIARHSPDSNDLLWEGELSRATPAQRDVATVRALYRTPADVQP